MSWPGAAFSRCEVARTSLESHNHHHVTDSTNNRLNLHRCANVWLQKPVQSQDNTGRHKKMAANQLRVPCLSLCFCDFLFYFEVSPSSVMCRLSFPSFVWFPALFSVITCVSLSAPVCLQSVCSLTSSILHLSLFPVSSCVTSWCVFCFLFLVFSLACSLFLIKLCVAFLFSFSFFFFFFVFFFLVFFLFGFCFF